MVEIHWTHHVLGWEMAQILWVGRDHSLSILKLEFWTHSETFESVLATDAIMPSFIYFQQRPSPWTPSQAPVLEEGIPLDSKIIVAS